MSLIKQLWLAVILIVFVCFLGSTLISIKSAKEYFEQQLYVKNVDNANALAMTLSQLDKDLITIELLITATFDTGHYARIELVSAEDNTSLITLNHEGEIKKQPPDWFLNLVQFNIKPGVAQVSDGWGQYGTLYVESHSQYAMFALWETCIKLFFQFFAVAIIAGFLGSSLLKIILKPLKNVVKHAVALGNKQFIKSPVPRTPEFAVVVEAINTLSVRFKKTIMDGNKRLEKMRFQTQHDQLTGLANRDYFMGALSSAVSLAGQEVPGAIFLFKIANLTELSSKMDKSELDDIICEISESLIIWLEEVEERYKDSHVARLSGSEFAVLFSETVDIDLISQTILKKHNQIAQEYQDEFNLSLNHVGCYIEEHHSISTLLKPLESILAIAEQKNTVYGETIKPAKPVLIGEADIWKMNILNAIRDDSIKLSFHSVLTKSGMLSHKQVMAGIGIQEHTYFGGAFSQWTNELGLYPEFDLAALQLIIRYLDNHKLDAVSFLVHESSLVEPETRQKMVNLLSENKELIKRLYIEVRESVAISHRAEFISFCKEIKNTGAKFGLRQVGAKFSKVPKIHELGFDTIKVDCAYVHNIANNQSNQFYIRGLCVLAHSIGIEVVADGISSPLDAELIFEMGCDAMIPSFQDKSKEEF
ncbi:EAL domain-containing protein [Catenovulum sp. 2E275]|uniref:bifunctional diguanylate cyclase/phosphodiesterase n=1 Tax=Catenovulum sp. 2E275 TaxID=2980497 RepID=UPI0021CE5683|nr:LapD/MoxY N-terminal periplasmic domain-containing protein [Catenovulum sp. 2E275]MCU4676843.1 EAL domain-containing protein [Catenovulum sp. 2E275]